MKRNTILSFNLIAIFLLLFIAGGLNADGTFNFIITSPSGGEEWKIDSVVTIEYNHDNHHGSDEDRITIKLCTEENGEFVAVDTVPIPNDPSGDGDIEWTVSGPATETAWLRLLMETADDRTWGGDTMDNSFTIITPTSIIYKQAINNVTSFSILQQPARALNVKMYDLNGRMVWEAGDGVYSFRKLKNGTYLLMYGQSKQRIAQKINLVR